MVDSLKLGEKLYKESIRGKRSGDKILDALKKSLVRVNKHHSKMATNLYNSVFKKLEIDNNTGLIVNSVENLALVREITSGLEPVTNSYRMRYGELLREFREDAFVALAEKEERVGLGLKKIGMVEDRTLLTPEAFEQMAILNEKGFRQVNALMLKWKDTVYDLFISGVNKGMTLIGFRNSFYNDSGTVKIGSSLEQESTAAAIIAITEQRTAFVRQKAKENGYTYCWNANPMDPLTKPECISASLAGVISEAEMGSEYGFPPRYVCRCEIVYTKPEWVGVNQGVNQAIRERRKALITSLENAPRQKSYWYWTDPTGKRKRVWADDPDRASGDKMYKETAEKLALVRSKTVPDYRTPRGGGPPAGGTPPPPVSPAGPAPAPVTTARSMEELEEKFRSMGLGTPDFEGYSAAQSLNIGNRIAWHFEDMYARFPGIADRGIMGQQLFDFEIIKGTHILHTTGSGGVSASMGLYNAGYYRIQLAGSARKVNSLSLGRRSWTTGSDLFSTARHEFGHHLWYNSVPELRQKFVKFRQSKESGYFGRWVSKYADTNASEAFAETFAAYTSPLHRSTVKRTLPVELTDLLDEFFK